VRWEDGHGEIFSDEPELSPFLKALNEARRLATRGRVVLPACSGHHRRDQPVC
jgi:hypothetical protein